MVKGRSARTVRNAFRSSPTYRTSTSEQRSRNVTGKKYVPPATRFRRYNTMQHHQKFEKLVARICSVAEYGVIVAPKPRIPLRFIQATCFKCI